MWGLFAISFLMAVVFLYVPGYLFNRVFFSRSLKALAFAPVSSIAYFTIAGMLLFPLKLSWFVLPLILLLINLVLFFFFKKPREKEQRREYLTCVIYVLCGLVVSTFVFLCNVDSAISFSVLTDTTFHLSCAQAMLDSGHYSVLHTSEYPEVMTQGNGAFYPAAWHLLVAFAAGAVSVPVTLASNAVNYAICSVVFPLSVWLFLSRLFRDKNTYVVAGGLVCSLFAAFPWNFLVVGQYDANLLAFALIPSLLFLLVSVFDTKGGEFSLAVNAFLIAIAGFSLAVAQTNALFASGVLCLPLIMRFIWNKCEAKEGSFFSIKRLAALIVACLIVAVIWYVAYSLPFMQSVVQVQRPICATTEQALCNILTVSFGIPFAPQIVLGLLVFLGLIIVVYKKREFLWILASYILVCLLYFVCAAVDNPIRQILCGFWYSGVNKIGGMVVFAAIPLAAIALCELIGLIRRKFCFRNCGKPACLVCAFLLIMSAVLYFPLKKAEIEPGLVFISGRIEADYEYANIVSFDENERSFIRKVKTYIDDEPVINIPADGSAWLYATEGINVRYRQFYSVMNNDYELFKTSLAEVATNPNVAEAVKESGVRYVLLLDEKVHIGLFDETEWDGILTINDNTPGFEPVLSDGAMRLYKITV